MIRSILFPLADGNPAASAREFALWLARTESGHLQFLAVIDVKAFEVPVLGTPDGFMPTVVAPPVQEGRSLLAELTASAREHLERCAAECAARGLSCSTEIRTGIPGEVIAREAVAHDLVVMARMGYSRPAGAAEQLDPLVPQVIRGSIRPVLVAGRKFPASGDVRTIMVAFDGSAHAGRALSVAAQLGRRSHVECTLATVAGSDQEGLDTLAPAEAYLYHHGLVPKRHVAIGAKASDSICELVTSLGADVLVMGAYGHGPIREMLFGSTTEHVLKMCACTVILQS